MGRWWFVSPFSSGWQRQQLRSQEFIFWKQWRFESCNSWSAMHLYKVRGCHLSPRSWKPPFSRCLWIEDDVQRPRFPVNREEMSYRERGIRFHRTATKENLKIDRIMDRLAYATIRQDFDWRNVIFSDEAVVSSGNYGPPSVFRIDGHRYDERFVARLHKSGRVSVACWGWNRSMVGLW